MGGGFSYDKQQPIAMYASCIAWPGWQHGDGRALTTWLSPVYPQMLNPNQVACRPRMQHKRLSPQSDDHLWDVEWGTLPRRHGQTSSWRSVVTLVQEQACPSAQDVARISTDVPSSVQGSQQECPEFVDITAPASATSVAAIDHLSPKDGDLVVCGAVAEQLADTDRACLEICGASSDAAAQSTLPGAGSEEQESRSLPSVGSQGHDAGTCKRCSFFAKGRCKDGYDCMFCHFNHEPRKRPRRRGGRAGRVEVGLDVARGLGDAEPCNEDRIAAVTGDSAHGGNLTTSLDVQESDNTADVEVSIALQPHSSDTFDSDDGCVASIMLGGEKYAGSYDESTTDGELGFSSQQRCSEASDFDEGYNASSVCQSSNEAETAMDCTHGAKSLGLGTPNKDDDITRQVRSILNKFTPFRFEVLCKQVEALPLRTHADLGILVAEVFRTATTQRIFLPLYADLCVRINTHLAANRKGDIGGKAFCRAIVNECQATFEQHLHTSQDSEGTPGDDEVAHQERAMKVKMRQLGNIRLIGELLVRELLAAKLLLPIVSELLNQGTDEGLESLVALLNVVGPHWEQRGLHTTALQDLCYRPLRRKITDKAVSTRVRFLVREVLETRDRGWVPRK